MPSTGWIIGAFLVIVVLFIIGFVLGINYRKRVAEKEMSSAEEEAKRIINEGIKSAENKKREALLEAKEEIHKNRSELEREVRERRSELSKQERRLQQKEENLDKKTDHLDKKTEALNEKMAAVEAQEMLGYRFRTDGYMTLPPRRLLQQRSSGARPRRNS